MAAKQKEYSLFLDNIKKGTTKFDREKAQLVRFVGTVALIDSINFKIFNNH